ncbi:MAG: hypothetical protein JO267_14900 [Alphaproteobacteria bacterium]|nr:hypothetical protein [Alphaproteobacteria bacterium]
MRPIDLLLVVLSGLIVLAIGFGPLFNSPAGTDKTDKIRQECERFYGPSGPAAFDRCVAEMTARAAH